MRLRARAPPAPLGRSRTSRRLLTTPAATLPRRKDSTAGFHGPQHPTRVFDIIDDFLIGTLVESDKDK